MKQLFAALFFLAASHSLVAATPVKALTFPNGGKEGDIKVDSTGQIHLVYLKDDAVFYASSSDQGQTFTTSIQVSAPGEPAQGHMFRVPQLSLGRDTTVHAIWYPQQGKLDQKDWGVRYARMTKGDGKFSAPVNLGHVPSDNYSLATDGQGQVAVFWTTSAVWVAQSKDDGVTFAPAQQVASLDPCDCCATAPAFDAGGKLALLYRDKHNNDRNIFYVADVLNAPEKSVRLNAENWHLNACPVAGNSLARLTGDAFIGGWEEKGSVYVTLPSSSSGPPKQFLLGKGKFPITLGLPDSTYFAAWKQGDAALWKILDVSGTELSSGKIDSPGSYAKPSAALSAKGEVLVMP